MIKIEDTKAFGFEHAMKIMRLPLESIDKADSKYNSDNLYCLIGDKDMELSKKLFLAGPDHSKHLDHIMVQCIITGPRYWLAELMTYTTLPARPVSGSTMHNLLKRPVKFDDFEQWNMTCETQIELDNIIPAINKCIADGDLLAAKSMLPESYKQARGFTFNYTNLANIYKQRKNHRLKEWQDFCEWIEDLPYSELITCSKYEGLNDGVYKSCQLPAG